MASGEGVPYGNLVEALQMSLYFFDAQKSGPARTLGRQPLAWRHDSHPGDAEIPLVPGDLVGGLATAGTNLPAAFLRRHRQALDRDGCGTLDLSRGFHDAGDHVKFGLPQAFAAATLAWSVYEFADAFVRTGTYRHVMDQLTWFCDYLLRSVFRGDDGEVLAFNYMVGRGHLDHAYWGPPEAQRTPRPATLAHAGHPASDQAGASAAALALMSLLTRASDPEYAHRCLDTARSLYAFGVTHRGLGHGDGFYPSKADADKLAWAAVWLYVATGEERFLIDVIDIDWYGNYTGYLAAVATPGSDRINVWAYSWDGVWPAVFAVLAEVTEPLVPVAENRRYWRAFRWNLEYWSGGSVKHVETDGDEGYIGVSPAGYSVLCDWGSARFNAAAQLCALVYRRHGHLDTVGGPDIGRQLSDWALSQMNYLMGANPAHRSYIVGYTARPTDHYAHHPHHRGAHGSLTNDPDDPPEHRHVLWGALVGGPDCLDRHVDTIHAHTCNEVALDYNAALVAALAGLVTYHAPGTAAHAWVPPAQGEAA